MTIKEKTIGWNFDNSYSNLPKSFIYEISPVPVKSPELVILNYDELSPINEGDRVYTSGDGNKFPENLFVGTVMKKSSGDLIIKPSIDINNINYVYILDWSLKDRGIDIKADPIFYD